MKKQQQTRLHQFAGFVGDFIRYWGFRRIHGQIWTLVYLSETSLSGSDIVKILKVSKALVSPALRELEQEGLLVPLKSENSKTKRYGAEDNVTQIIRLVLLRREQPMIANIQKSFDGLSSRHSAVIGLNQKRIDKLGALIQSAQLGLSFLLESEDLWK